MPLELDDVLEVRGSTEPGRPVADAEGREREAVNAAIKRFEYNFELAWKTVKHFARSEGETCNSPKEALKTALKLNWIEDDKVWLDILDDRNQTTHTYQESTAASVYRNLPRYYEAFVSLHRALTQLLERP